MNQIKAPLIISPQKLPKRSINSTYVPSKEKDTQSNIVSKPSRNAEYFKSILDFPKAFSRTYHNDQLNKGIKDQLKTIYKEDKVLNTNIESNSDNKKEKEVDKMSSKSKFKVVEKNITLESELATYKVSNEGITTDCIDGKMTTFKDKDEANKLIGRLINKLMDLDEEIKDIWKEYIDR